MSATRLLVLGVVRIHGRAHGYRVGRELLSWNAGEWANVKWGSIYHALRKLSREGKLREFVAEGDEVVDRTSYALTDDGEAEFHRLLRAALSHSGHDHALLCAGVTLMTALPRDEAVTMLERRLAGLEGVGAEVRAGLDQEHGRPPHVAELFGLWRTTVEAETGWTRQLIASLREGRYTMADDGPGAFGLPKAGK
ncbi:PadR family transcriptional regulator [Nocardiopsis sp. EMB25]|uniref:PadR family transcriptional regulator n=1 Tax=Nocardiopsis TaxID=2013 RepID=UPI000345676A|nr:MULTISPECIES: PadR family transcriptional regulator [Nocardiopsis]MCY9786058.1 PadR family transcriptional regulator [Nocardiopsis sp. EMB25]